MVDAPRDPKPGSTTRRQEQPASPLSRQEHTRSKSSSVRQQFLSPTTYWLVFREALLCHND
ncbi:hypothetical protein E2C01_092088 [Portunus trituberculatus]|uniref:Uncharacterized protein n=1 Tax=Portunus trituberculatus TaxID=210409 RepID=A0A5B7JPP3_PORTR|nr:hypothetical protein [Portunus trituberculatus]